MARNQDGRCAVLYDMTLCFSQTERGLKVVRKCSWGNTDTASNLVFTVFFAFS